MNEIVINIDITGYIVLSIGDNSVKLKSVGATSLIGELTKAMKDLQDIIEYEKKKVTLLKDYNGHGKIITFSDVK